MLRRILLSLVAGVQLLPALLAASTFYVSPTGNDGNPGTLAQPWLTIGHAAGAVGTVLPGDTVLIEPGTYNEFVTVNVQGTPGNPITFRPDPAGLGTVSVGNGGAYAAGAARFTFWGISYVTLQGLDIADVTNGAGIKASNDCVGLRFTGNSIHHITGPSSYAIVCYTYSGAMSGIVIDGNQVYDVTNCNQVITLGDNVSNCSITSNTIHDVENQGIDIVGGYTWLSGAGVPTNVLVQGNTLYNVSTPSSGNWGAVIYLDGAKNCTVNANTVRDSSGWGIQVSSSGDRSGVNAQNNLISNNLVYNCLRSGMDVGGWDTWLFNRADSNKFINNTLYHNDTSASGSGEFTVKRGNNNVFENNIVVAGPQNVALGSDPSVGASDTGNSFNFNDWHGPTPATLTFNWMGTGYSGLAAWKAGQSQDASSISQDPLFVAAGTDFHLQCASPCVDSGKNEAASGVTQDHDSTARPQGAAYDRGAYEMACGTSPTPTPTATRSATPTATRSASPTPTATRSATPSATATASPSASSTRTATPSASPSASATPSFSPSRTASPTATVTASPSASATRSASPSATPTSTDSPTRTATATASPTLSPSDTPSASPSRTVTPSRTATPSVTLSATPSATRTDTATRTATPSATPTATDSPVYTPTATPSASPTATASPSASPSVTASATRSASPSATASPTATPSATVTDSFSPTPTGSVTATATPTATPSPTSTPSPTRTGTPTVSLTVSDTPSVTVSPTVTETPVPLPFHINAAVYNEAGERVRVLFDGSAAALPVGLSLDKGSFQALADAVTLRLDGGAGAQGLAAWNGSNDQGQALSTGVYSVKVEVTDPFNSTQSYTLAVQVLAPPAAETVVIYNSAGEAVRRWNLGPGGAAGSKLVLSDKVLVLGAPGGLRGSYKDASGALQAWQWDGRNDAGGLVHPGSYLLKIASGKDSLYEDSVTVLDPGAGADPAPLLGPNPATNAGLAALGGLVVAYATAGVEAAGAALYTLDGGRVDTAADAALSGRLRLGGALALGPGVYWVVFNARMRDGRSVRKVLKAALVR